MKEMLVWKLDIGDNTKNSHSVICRTSVAKLGWKRIISDTTRNSNGKRGYGWLERGGFMLNKQKYIFMLKVREWWVFLVVKYCSNNILTVGLMLTSKLESSSVWMWLDVTKGGLHGVFVYSRLFKRGEGEERKQDINIELHVQIWAQTAALEHLGQHFLKARGA